MDASEAIRCRADILRRVRAYAEERWPEPPPFRPGRDPVPVSGRVFDAKDVETLVDASLDFWLTAGRFAAMFEREFPRWVGVAHCSLVNSGSSANLLALTALTSHLLGERRIRAGDEIITVAAGFPTTVNPIYQNGLVPVFIDITLPTYGADIAQLEAAFSSKVKAIMLAHTLGNPFNLDAVEAFAKERNLFVIEDNCDALGSEFHGRRTGTFGALSTHSFYPAHHITMGEGGAVLTNDDLLRRIVESFRDWGRDCWCKPGAANTCGRRFTQQFGALPFGYDHKYVYSHVGYNLKVTDMQAAVGCAQLTKLDGFVARRRENFRILRELLAPLEEYLILPEAQAGSEPSWFGFPITLREDAPISRHTLVQFLDMRRIGTRLLFGGNIIRQPADRNRPRRMIGELPVSDTVMRSSFWVGIYPGINQPMLEYIAECLTEAFTKKCSPRLPLDVQE